MFKGILYALAACALWGFVFVIPSLLADYTAFEIAFGRCAIFGLFSLGMLFFQRKEISQVVTSLVWKKAIQFSFVVNIVHYASLVLGLQYAGATLTTAILGLNPIAVIIYGNWMNKEIEFKYLILPCLFSVIGLLALHSDTIIEEGNHHYYGVTYALMALGTWVWFVIENRTYLKQNPSLPIQHWVTVVGVATLFWIALAIPFFISTIASLSYTFISGCAILGIGSSWLAHYFWNCAAQRLPIILAGQLSLFETIFGLLYIYVFRMSLPHFWELTGILLILASIGLAIRNKQLLLSNDWGQA